MYFSGWRRRFKVFQNHLWFEATKELVGGLLGYVMSPGVVCELRDRKDLAPAHWLTSCPGAKVLF